MQAMNLDPRVAGQFVRFAGGFWRGPTAGKAWTLTACLAACLALSTAATVCLTRWQRWFFDAVEHKDAATASWAVLAFFAIIAAMAAIGVGIVLSREALQVRWRAFIVERLISLWLGSNRFYLLAATHTEPDNPEYRISDDTRWATEPMVDLVIGMFSAVIGAAAFITILWSVGGSYTLHVGTLEIWIPAYMVVVALLYGAIASGSMLWIGRALVGCVARKNAAEGEFRFALMRIRENSESIALSAGGPSEEEALRQRYAGVVSRWLSIVHQHGRITWVTNASGPMIPVVPLLFAAPKYFSGDLTLGQMVELAAAFVQVQLAISWIVDNYNRLSEWFASARRVMDIVDACAGLDHRLADGTTGLIVRRPAPDGRLGAENLVVSDAKGLPLVDVGPLSFSPGTRSHIYGSTSAGKSSLVRALAGVWPWGEGVVRSPEGASMMVVPQKPYLPLGTLRSALLYPGADRSISEAEIEAALADAGLAHLVPRLDAEQRWDQVLGTGERQRLCVARALIQRPSIIVLDDALSSLDEASEAALEARIKARLPQATLVSLSQRERDAASGLARFEIDRRGKAATFRIYEPELV
ncbi:MAG: ABC transporter ATP-binding protein/permease [Proteobacteria bacterium]|nr:ABC transporter ATP-binding protein/permease [Pseudomonadota bacterium]